MKRRILMSLVMIGLVAALIGGATFAYFTSSATNASNTFATGNLVIGLYDNLDHPVTTPLFNITNLAPGDSGQADIVVKNTGSLELKYNSALASSGVLFGGTNPVQVTLWQGINQITNLSAYRIIAAGSQEKLTVKWIFPSGAGNEYQGASGSFDLSFNAIQTKNNP